MQENSFYKFCISACLFMIFISLAINLVSLTGAFPVHISGVSGGNSTDLAKNVTSSTSDVLSIFTGNISSLILIGLAGSGLAVAIAAAIKSSNWNIVSVYIFTTVFWGSWGKCLVLFHFGGFYDIPMVAMIVSILTLGMLLCFGGAVIGLLHLGEG
jgi:hypothetical protein